VAPGDLGRRRAAIDAGDLDGIAAALEDAREEGAHARGAADDPDREAVGLGLLRAPLVHARGREEHAEDVARHVGRHAARRAVGDERLEVRVLAVPVEGRQARPGLELSHAADGVGASGDGRHELAIDGRKLGPKRRKLLAHAPSYTPSSRNDAAFRCPRSSPPSPTSGSPGGARRRFREHFRSASACHRAPP
jgi:hypothetical protein